MPIDVEELRRLEETARAGGDRSRLRTKLPVRERLELLLDAGSWTEDGLLASSLLDRLPADGVLTGVGTIGGRAVAVIAHDPTVKAGSWGGPTVEKQIRILERADRDLLPVFYLVDSAGGRLTDQMGFFPNRRGAARIFHLQVRLSGRVPQLCCLFGPSAAGGAYMPAFCDWVGMVDGQASMYLASPRIAEMTTGEKVTLDEMGGAKMHTTVSGMGDELFEDDAALLRRVGELFAYLPATYRQRPPVAAQAAEPEVTDWAALIPENSRRSYDIRGVIGGFVDADSFLEIKRTWAREMVTGMARLGGAPIGIVASQPKVKGGAIFPDSADKASRFILLCDAFNIPIVFLQDLPGFMVGSAVERQGIIRHGARMVSAMSSAEVPKFTVVVRKAFAAGFYAMAAPGFEPRATIALSTADIGAMGAEAAVNAVYANKIAAMEDEDERNAFVETRRREYAEEVSLQRMASELIIDTIVAPADLRAELLHRLAAAAGWEREAPRRHHPVWPG